MKRAATVIVLLLLAPGLPAAAQTPAPYRSEPLSVINGGVTLSGTLTMPHGSGPFPAVVLITGSGGQNRDEDIFGFKVFGVLADHLTRHGIAVYRYDGLARLAAIPDIDPARVGLLGHSEGAAAASIAAAKSPAVKFIVMLAGPGVPGDIVTRRQATDTARAMGAGDEAVARIEAAHRAMVGDIPAWVEKTYRPHLAQIWSPWMKYFVAFDPADALRKVTVPVYAAFGGLDTQVLPELNAQPVRQALAGNARTTVKVYPEANHLFQRAHTGLVTEYATLDKAFLPGLLDDVATWIQTATRR